ncbi:MAG: beta-N-acetylhexosaminidase, partial [Butyrivibrio sp.]|nr:beta-N-acetylhexosaminidase [Butyrivibrio sp.]
MARLEEQDFDEKRLARRQRRKKSQLIAYIILAATCLVVFGGCAVLIYFLNGVIKTGGKSEEPVAVEEQVEEEVSQVIETPEVVQEPEEYTEEDMLGDIVGSVIEEQSLEDKVAGLFIITPEQLTGVDTAVKAGSGTQEALSSYAVGGIVYSSKNIKNTDQIKTML